MSSCDGVPLPWPLSSWSNVKEWIVGAVLQLVALQSVSIFSSGAIGEAPGGPPGAGDDGPLFGSSRLLQMGLPENRIPPKFHQISWCILYILIFPYFPYSHILNLPFWGSMVCPIRDKSTCGARKASRPFSRMHCCPWHMARTPLAVCWGALASSWLQNGEFYGQHG